MKFDRLRRKSVGRLMPTKHFVLLMKRISQNGVANLEMNRIIPNARYRINARLMRSEKKAGENSEAILTPMINMMQLEDKIILPLIYEGRYVEMTPEHEQIDRLERRQADVLLMPGTNILLTRNSAGQMSELSKNNW